MAKHFNTCTIRCAIAVCAIVGSTATWASPNTPTRKSASNPPRIPVVIKKIFPTKPSEATASDAAHSSAKPNDILKLGISKPGAARDAKSSSPVAAVATSTAALILVVGIFLLVAWFMKRGASRAMRSLPTGAFEILGRSSLNTRQVVQLVRIGNKLLLVATSADEVTTLTEIDDADEVNRLAGLCLQTTGTSATKEFHEAFAELAVSSGNNHADVDTTPPPSLLGKTRAKVDSVSFSDASLVLPAT